MNRGLLRPLLVLAMPCLLACAAQAPDAESNTRDATATAEFTPGGNVHTLPWGTPAEQPLINAASVTLKYYGGHVVSNAKVVQVLWGTGTYQGNVTSTATPSLATFYQQAMNSAYVDWLDGEYNTLRTAQNGSAGTQQHIGRGSFAGQYQIAPSVTSSTVDDTQIQAEINAQIGAGHLPAPDANTIYMVNFPHGKTITQGGSSSCVAGGFCAYHGTFTRSGASTYYGVLPDMQAGSGCDTGCGSSTVFNNQTSVASHELIETVTDAEVGLASVVGPPLAWYDSVQGEIGDICNAQQGSIAGSDGFTYTVQKEWSNAQQACIVSKTTPTNDFSISASPSSVSVAAGGSNSSTISTATTSGSAQTVNLSVSGAPAGVTATLTPTSVTSGQSSTLNISTTSSAAAGNYTLTVTGTAASGAHSTSVALTITSQSGGPTPLTNGVAVTNLSGATNAQQSFVLNVPAGQTTLTFQLSGGTGDADMYVKFGSQPTLSTYDCRPYVAGNSETCTFSNPAAGNWYVMLNGYSSYSGVSLKGTYSATVDTTPALTNGVPVSNISGASGSQQFWKLTVPAGRTTLTFNISGGSGDADMYVRRGAKPTTATYDCRPYLTGNNETCTFSSPVAADYYVMLRGYAAFSGVTLKGTYP